MTESRESRSIIEHAEQAAADGNYAAAEDLLREAAALQEQTLGSNHPDLANTFNNLGIVCEMTDNPIDAEHYFRRAHTIATATLAPDHPFVATSRTNLHDFCRARGRPLELPPSSPALAAWLDAPASPAGAPTRAPSLPATQPVASPIARTRSWRPLALGALAGAGILIVMLIVARPWNSPAEETTPPATTIAPAAATPTPTPLPPEPLPTPQPAPTVAPPVTTVAGAPTVVVARLCTALRSWRCEAAGSQVPPGPLFFYTQVKSATFTTIEHRWYQGDRLRRTVALRLEANPEAGYRTYSRSSVSRDKTGDWRVELRSAEGTVLHEERFTVQ